MKASKQKTPQYYSKDELRAIDDLFVKLMNEHGPDGRGGLLMQRKQMHEEGEVSKLPFASILRELEPGGWVSMAKADAGDQMCEAIKRNDSNYFLRLAAVLEARAQGLPLASLTRKELRMYSPPGRPKTATDIEFTLPAVLFGLIQECRCAKGRKRGDVPRVTYSKLNVRLKEAGRSISKFELSRWLNKLGFAPFLAEQPFARNPRKIANIPQ